MRAPHASWVHAALEHDVLTFHGMMQQARCAKYTRNNFQHRAAPGLMAAVSRTWGLALHMVPAGCLRRRGALRLKLLERSGRWGWGVLQCRHPPARSRCRMPGSTPCVGSKHARSRFFFTLHAHACACQLPVASCQLPGSSQQRQQQQQLGAWRLGAWRTPYAIGRRSKKQKQKQNSKQQGPVGTWDLDLGHNVTQVPASRTSTAERSALYVSQLHKT
jgi:hypothetical protein